MTSRVSEPSSCTLLHSGTAYGPPARAIGRWPPNSDVLPFGAVAVTLTDSVEVVAAANVTAKLALPLPSEITVADPSIVPLCHVPTDQQRRSPKNRA